MHIDTLLEMAKNKKKKKGDAPKPFLNNFVAKHDHNKAATFRDKKKDYKRSPKHKSTVVETEEKAYYTMEPRKNVGEFWVFKNQKVNGKNVKKHIDSFDSEATARKWYPSLGQVLEQYAANKTYFEPGKVYYQIIDGQPYFFKPIKQSKNGKWQGKLVDPNNPQRALSKSATDSSGNFHQWTPAPEEEVPDILRET